MPKGVYQNPDCHVQIASNPDLLPPDVVDGKNRFGQTARDLEGLLVGKIVTVGSGRAARSIVPGLWPGRSRSRKLKSG